MILWIQIMLRGISVATSCHYSENHRMVEVGRDCLLSCRWTLLKRAWLHFLYTLPSAFYPGQGPALSCYHSQKTKLINTVMWPKKEANDRKSNQEKQNREMFWGKKLHLFYQNTIDLSYISFCQIYSLELESKDGKSQSVAPQNTYDFDMTLKLMNVTWKIKNFPSLTSL